MKPAGSSRAGSKPLGAAFVAWTGSRSGLKLVLVLAIDAESAPWDSLGREFRFGNRPGCSGCAPRDRGGVQRTVCVGRHHDRWRGEDRGAIRVPNGTSKDL